MPAGFYGLSAITGVIPLFADQGAMPTLPPTAPGIEYTAPAMLLHYRAPTDQEL